MTTGKQLIAILALGGLLLGGCAFLMKLASAAIDDLKEGKVSEKYTPENEYYIGRGVSAAIIDKYPSSNPGVGHTTDQIVYLNQMAGYIEAASLEVDRYKLGNHVDRNEDEKKRLDAFALYKGMHVGLLETEEVMAYSTPGGFIWISRGTVNMCQSEDELAAVVAHEIGHTVLNHGMEAYRKATKGSIFTSKTFQTATGELVGDNFAKLIGSYGDNLVQNGYGKDQEYEADHFALRAMAAAGYNPRSVIDMFKRLQEYEKKHAKDEGLFTKNHPDVKDRIAALEKVLKDPKSGIKAPADDPGKEARAKRFKEVWGR